MSTSIGLNNSRDRHGGPALLAAIVPLHVVGFGTLLLFVAPHHYRVGEQIVGLGLGITAYTFGLQTELPEHLLQAAT